MGDARDLNGAAGGREEVDEEVEVEGRKMTCFYNEPGRECGSSVAYFDHYFRAALVLA
jgi:hypothetical protein